MPGMPGMPTPPTLAKKKRPDVNVRRIRWTPAQRARSASAADSPQIWDDDDSIESEGNGLDDDDEMRLLFVQKRVAKKQARGKGGRGSGSGAGGGKKKGAKTAAGPTVTIDGKRTMNVALGVAKLRLKDPVRLAELGAGIATLDLNALRLDAEGVEALLPLLPDAGETQQLVAFAADPASDTSTLDEAAAFFHGVVVHFPPRAAENLRSIRFMCRFADAVAGAQAQVSFYVPLHLTRIMLTI
jgi:hypothetical protein